MAKEKLKIPKSVLDLRLSPKKYAKKHNIRIKRRKGMSRKEVKHNQKRLERAYAVMALNGLNKGVRILIEHPDHKKIGKVKKGVDNIISQASVMERVAKLYKKDPSEYANMMYLPYMIVSTLNYLASAEATEADKAAAADLDPAAMIKFCERILKKQIRRYEKAGLSEEQAFNMAVYVPTMKIFKSNRRWYREFIQAMYAMAEKTEVDLKAILQAVLKVDKKRPFSRSKFAEEFYSEVIMQKSSNRTAKFTESQKDLHESRIESTLSYLNDLKSKDLLEKILRNYIKRRKRAEEYKNDGKRIIKFTDHANSNSPYPKIKKVVTELISENSSYELYLS